MKRRIPLSLACFLGLALIAAASGGRQETRIAPPANQVKRATPINMAARPDLKVAEVWLAESGAPTASGPGARLTGRAPLGRRIWLACKLTNAGADLKTAFVVTYLVDGEAVGSERIRGLAAGRTALSAVAYEAQSAGPHKLRCEADREGKIAETTRDNNALEITFVVGGGPAPAKALSGLKSGEIERPAVQNPANPTGPIGPEHGTTGVIDNKSTRTPRSSGAAGSAAPSPSDEPSLASVSFPGSGTLTPLEVPDTLNGGVVLVAELSSLMLFRSADLSPLGSISLDGDIRDRSATVLAGTGKPTTFVTTAAGTVYGIDSVGMVITWQRTFRRPGCSSDGLTAGPVVHLRRNASTAFKARYGTDLVYVATNYSATSACTTGHDTANRIYALQATDGLPVWTFNETGSLGVDGVTRSGSLDVAYDRFFVATKRDYSAAQHTVWAIDVLSGAPAWSTNAGGIENPPVPLDDRILAVSRTGLVSALDRNTGGLVWNLQVGQPPSPSVARMTAATVPNIGRAAFLVMAGSGRVRMVKDNGGSGEVVWDIALPGGRKAMSRASFEPIANMLYVGADDGQVYQIEASSGAVTANRVIDATGTGIVGDPLIWQAGGVAKLVAGSSKGTLAIFLLPWPTETFGQ